MGPPDIVVIGDLLGALAALGSFVHLARTKLRDARRLGVAGAILAACYVAGYSVASWSSTMRSVSVVAWPVVWVATPLLLARVCRRVLRIDAAAGEALEEARSAAPSCELTEEEPPT